MPIIEIENVTKKFGSKVALSDVSLEVDAGQIFGFLGPNGAGKSTTIRCVMGYIFPDVGSILIEGNKVSAADPRSRETIGYVPSDLYLNGNWTAQEHIDFIANARKLKPDLKDIVNNLDIELNEPAKRLSTGNRQKLGLLIALVNDPKILILDEPTKGLDPLLQEALYQILIDFKDKGGCIFFSSHNLTEVERICDKVAIIRNGKIVANETIDDLRGKRVHVARVLFEYEIDKQIFEKFGEIKSIHKNDLEIHIEGKIDPFIIELSKHKILDISLEHASLEDVFLHFYKESK